MRYEAIIYDIRDKDKDQPESSLGDYNTRAEASEGIFQYLSMFPQFRPFIYKIEIVERKGF